VAVPRPKDPATGTPDLQDAAAAELAELGEPDPEAALAAEVAALTSEASTAEDE
jgi:hypothetical protein